MYLKVRILFDPTSLGSATLAAYERQIQEYEWRLSVMAESHDVDQNAGTDTVCRNADSITLKDRASGISHKLYVENSQLVMTDEEV